MAIIKYRAHCADFGWQAPVEDGQIAGTIGEHRALECYRIEELNVPGLNVHAFAHVQDLGWSAGNTMGEDVGSTGLGKHIEAVKIGLIGENAGEYDIWYRLHVADRGFLNWSKNGEVNGTTGGNVQAEAIQIEVHAKSENWYPYVDAKESFIDLTPQTSPADLAEMVMQEASAWVGYLAEEDNVFGYDNYCIAFVCHCLRVVGVDFIETAWCDDAVHWAKERGRWTDTPQRGFPIAFDWDGNGVSNHFGFVDSVRDDGGVNTIEANTSGPNGIGIYRKVRYPEDGIEGYINPY